MLKSNDLTPRFEVDAALKDLTLALELSAEHQHSALLAEAAREAYQRASRLSLGDKDLTALRVLYRTP